MSVTFTKPVVAGAKKPGRNGCAKPLSLDLINLDKPGRLRKGHLMTLLSIGSTCLWSRIRSGDVPPPDGHDGQVGKHARPFWNTETIRLYLLA